MGNVTFHITITMLHAERQIDGLYCIITSSGTQLGSNWIFTSKQLHRFISRWSCRGANTLSYLFTREVFTVRHYFFQTWTYPASSCMRVTPQKGITTFSSISFLHYLLSELAAYLFVYFIPLHALVNPRLLTDLSAAMQLMGSTKELHNRPVV